jgi:hypothetical protein
MPVYFGLRAGIGGKIRRDNSGVKNIRGWGSNLLPLALLDLLLTPCRAELAVC